MYETGSASDRIDLLDRIRIAASALGWVERRWSAGDGWLALEPPAGGVVYHMRPSGGANIAMRGALDYDPGASWTVQPGAQDDDTLTNAIAGPYHAYHLYATQDYIHVVIEAEPGRHRHLGVGVIERYGSWSGGEYVHGTFWGQGSSRADVPDSAYHSAPFDGRAFNFNTYLTTFRVDIDGLGSQWRRVSREGGSGTVRGVVRGEFDDASIMARLYYCTPTTITGIAQLIPIVPLVGRAGDSTRMSPAGHVRDMRYVHMQHLQPGEVITIGTDEWQVWPLVRRVGVVVRDGTEQSGYYGLAYRRVP